MSNFVSFMFGAHFPNTAFAETGPREQCAVGVSLWEFWSISALCRLQSTGSSLLSVAVLASSLARFCGPFSYIIRSLMAGLYSSVCGYVFLLPSIFPWFALAVRPFRFRMSVSPNSEVSKFIHRQSLQLPHQLSSIHFQSVIVSEFRSSSNSI